jgi:chorismate synthase
LAGNSVGKEFAVTCFGESHGKCIGVIVDGCPAGLSLSEQDIQVELNRRIPPQPKIVSARIEKDTAEILSGVFNGFTTGTPICVLVRNKEAISSDYDVIRDAPRPGHADYTARIKYGGFSDYRGGGRFSGRVTVALVMAGTIAKKLLKLFKIEVLAYTTAIGNVKLDRTLTAEEIRRNKYKSSVRCPDLKCTKAMEKAILKVKSEGDSLGGIVECTALNVPAGVGEPFFDSLDADIAKMLFNVPAVKGVEFGAGFKSAELKGSENNDAYVIQNGKIVTSTNNAGGILGGISSGMPILVRAAIKPTSSISNEQKTINLSKMEETTIQVKGRHDPCIVPKAVPVIESAVAIVLADHMLRAGKMPEVLKERK